MKLAVMTRSATLFGLICRCFEADGAVCHRFADDVAFARAIYRDEYSAILIDADTGLNPLRPVLARRACYADRRAPLIVIGAGHDREAIARLFDAGADDVVLSPVDAREVMLRVHLALLRVQLQSADSSDTLECGAYRLDRRTCTVHVDGQAMRSCVAPVSTVAGRKVTTIEGLQSRAAKAVQKAWVEHDVVQCGYCQFGQIMSATVLLEQNPRPTDDDIDLAMAGNICRCATYMRIRAAIHAASATLTA